jgi:hypothetical protein
MSDAPRCPTVRYSGPRQWGAVYRAANSRIIGPDRMSYELIGILVVGLLLGAGQLAALVTVVYGFRTMGREMARSFQEMTRVQRAVASRVVQESEKIQALLRP